MFSASLNPNLGNEMIPNQFSANIHIYVLILFFPFFLYKVNILCIKWASNHCYPELPNHFAFLKMPGYVLEGQLGKYWPELQQLNTQLNHAALPLSILSCSLLSFGKLVEDLKTSSRSTKMVEEQQR